MYTKMHEEKLCEKTIITNAPGSWREDVPCGKGNDKKGYRMVLPDELKQAGFTWHEKLVYFVDRGYTTIRFERITTAIRGVYQEIAYVK